MNQDGLLFDALKEIDKRRGDMGRASFVWYLLDQDNTFQAQRLNYVTHEELEDFRQWVKDLLRSFLDFAVTFGLGFGTHSENGQKRLPAGLRRPGANGNNAHHAKS